MSEPPARGPVVGSMRVTLGALDSSVSMKPMPMQVSIWLELLGKMLMKISWKGIGVQQTAAAIVEVDRRDGNRVSADSATRRVTLFFSFVTELIIQIVQCKENKKLVHLLKVDHLFVQLCRIYFG
jgi:hypothetical protein